MFAYSKFDVEVARELEVTALGWPAPGEAAAGSGLGCNREYEDLRRLSWADAERVFAVESALIARIENAEDAEEEWERISEELCEEDHLFGLDLGVASSVVCLSAARCVPFTSCNGGSFGGGHFEVYPLVAFFARPQVLDLIIGAAREADIGLHNGTGGSIVAYADDIRNMRRFAASVMSKRAQFNAVRLRRPATRKTTVPAAEQSKLPFM